MIANFIQVTTKQAFFLQLTFKFSNTFVSQKVCYDGKECSRGNACNEIIVRENGSRWMHTCHQYPKATHCEYTEQTQIEGETFALGCKPQFFIHLVASF